MLSSLPRAGTYDETHRVVVLRHAQQLAALRAVLNVQYAATFHGASGRGSSSPAPCLPLSMFMTEGIVEEVSGVGFDILLGLPWTDLPYWHAVYGGYGYATGRAGSGGTRPGGVITRRLRSYECFVKNRVKTQML